MCLNYKLIVSVSQLTRLGIPPVYVYGCRLSLCGFPSLEIPLMEMALMELFSLMK